MITIFGGSGFIGSRITGILSESGTKYVNVDIKEPTGNSASYLKGDVRQIDGLKAQLQGTAQIINLAAEHQDNVRPIDLYYSVNVEGARELVRFAEENNIKKIIFTSSAAVYGLHDAVVDEETAKQPFNHYGKSKLQAEEVYLDWQQRTGGCLIMIRPTVIFGEGNRGNVYNLLKQINEGTFSMVGSGENRKSMAYVANIADFIIFCANNLHDQGVHIFNYSDEPDLTMNQLVEMVSKKINKPLSSIRIPYFIGLLAGYGFDLLSFLSGRKFPVSAVRVKKFCANTQFSAGKLEKTGFTRRFTLIDGLEQTLNHEFGKLTISH